VTVGQRFARSVTALVVRVPGAWRLFRGPMARMFDRIAPEWEGRRTAGIRLAPAVAALEALPAPPARILDVGTGTGALARTVAARFPDAEVVGVDVSSGMIDVARTLAGPRERYETGDASALAFGDGSFDLVTLNNMIPFFDELSRVTAPGGHVLVAFALGPRTPIWVPLDRVRAELERRGFDHVGDYAAGDGVSLLATRR
jgi:ubiquinone/menaquinone biosynthesis C-methylase UbiE